MKNYGQLLLPLLLLTFSTCKDEGSGNQHVSIGAIETLHSDVLNEDRTVWVHVPDHNEKDSVRYPVLYLMDGSANFKAVVGLMHHMSTSNGNSICPKMIIVAILNTDRMRDLTPTKMVSKNSDVKSEPRTGGGEAFTKFIADELIPFIDKKYPSTNQRTLVGHSLGGLIVINTLVQHPELFEKYLAIDPSLWWNDQESLKQYEEAIRANNFQGKSLFIGIANTINMDTLAALTDTTQSTQHFRSINSFVNTLRKTNSHGLDWQAKYYPEDHHSSVPLISEYDAFHFLYRKIPIKMELAHLKQFEGKYTHRFREGEDLFLDIAAKDGFLAVTESWRNVEMKFDPVGGKDFYTFREKFLLEFHTDARGKAVEVVAFGRDVWKRVE